MTILDKIIADKNIEVAQRKALFPVSFWEQSPLFEKATVSISECLKIVLHASSPNTKEISIPRHINCSLSIADVAKL